MPLSNKVALVTGASKGLGRAIAQRLGQAGCRLALLARDSQQLQQLAEQLRSEYAVEILCLNCDLSDQQQLQQAMTQLLHHYGHVDILINNAGTGWYKPFLDHDIDEHHQIIDVNFKAPVLLCQALLPTMIKRQHGQIINIASDLSTRPLANMAVYSASKFALRGFSLSLMREVKSQGIKVSLLNPGIIDSSFNQATPGQQAAEYALPPAQLAETVYQLLCQDPNLLIDELTIHPPLQDF